MLSKRLKRQVRPGIIDNCRASFAIDEEMMKEIPSVKDCSKSPMKNTLCLFLNSMTGQDAVNTAKEFNERLDFDGVVVTKLDGDTRGGAALSIKIGSK